MKKTISGISMFSLWLGAAVSLAEIMTGSLLAPLGLAKGIAVILTGHIIGTVILTAVGAIGFLEKKTAMETAMFSFGYSGAKIIALLNCIQLIGWTSIMLIQCSKSLQVVTEKLFGFHHFMVLTILAGLLVLLWTLWGYHGKHLINNLAVILLVGLCLYMITFIFKGTPVPTVEQVSLPVALELSIIMPLSWLPLISDYTRSAKSLPGSLWGSFLGYFLGSSFMYIIGLACTIYTGSTNPIEMLTSLQMGPLAIIIILLSTMTTTFLDVYSSVMSTRGITKRFSQSTLIVAYSAIGTVLALYFPMESYQSFLYMIGSVFAPVFTIVLMDYYVLKKDYSHSHFNIMGIIAAAVGIYTYYQLVKMELLLGNAVPAMLVTGIIYAGLTQVTRYMKGKNPSTGIRLRP